MYEAIEQGLLTARLDESSIGGAERHRVRRTRVLQMWPHKKTAGNWCGRGRAVHKQKAVSTASVRKERFWDKVDKRSRRECWQWQSGRPSQGQRTLCAKGSAPPQHKV